MGRLWRRWRLIIEDAGQDIAEYAVILAVILVVVIGVVKIVGQATRQNLDKAEDVIQTPGAQE